MVRRRDVRAIVCCGVTYCVQLFAGVRLLLSPRVAKGSLALYRRQEALNVSAGLPDVIEVVFGSILLAFVIAFAKPLVRNVIIVFSFLLKKLKDFLECLRLHLCPESGTMDCSISEFSVLFLLL